MSSQSQFIWSKEEVKKVLPNKAFRHIKILMWKSYIQRQRRWRLLVLESIFACIFFVIAVIIAKPVFLTALQAEPEPPLSTIDIINSLSSNNIVGFTPTIPPYVQIMVRASKILEHDIVGGASEEELVNYLVEFSKKTLISAPVIWVIWKPKVNDTWQFSIRSTERSVHESTQPHLHSGFLAVQMAISRAIIDTVAAPQEPQYQMSLVSMPVTPLMHEAKVTRTLSGILLCFTSALVLPILETVALVVRETSDRYKKALCLRNVSYACMYTGWLTYGLLTSFPVSVLAATTLVLIFRWVHLLQALVLILSYVIVMTLVAFNMSMFHSKAWIAVMWTALYQFLQSYVAELLVLHQYGREQDLLSFLLHVLVPPLGLVHAFNKFALLQTGQGVAQEDSEMVLYTLVCWVVVGVLCFGILMLLQYTISQDRTIGGQVSWRSIIFKEPEDVHKLHIIRQPTGRERDRLQEVDELVAKAVSFENVTKSEMGTVVIKDLTMDIYRGEFTMLFAERVQAKLLATIENLLTGLTSPDAGTIRICGQEMTKSTNLMTVPQMMGYCHRSTFLINDLTVREHFILYFDIILWSKTRHEIMEYSDVRTTQLLEECGLHDVTHCRIRDLDYYYKAQLCWALAVLLEPRVVIVSHFVDPFGYIQVIRDKIVKCRKYITVVKICHSSYQLEFADRAFLFDTKTLAFGGTPAYFFFKFGREYRVRLTLRADRMDADTSEALLDMVTEAGATVRAHLVSLMILQIPVNPSERVAALINEVHINRTKYGVTSMNISLADSEELFRRAVAEAKSMRRDSEPIDLISLVTSASAIQRITEPTLWTRKKTPIYKFMTHLKVTGWKVLSFYAHNKLFLLLLILSAIGVGVEIGVSFSKLLKNSERESATENLMHGELLTVENTNRKTRLMLRADKTDAAISIANSYIFSEPNATQKQVDKIGYSAITRPQSLTEYFVSRAIDAPQKYIFWYAYGLDVFTNDNQTLVVNPIYGLLHFDNYAAARSMAKAFTALLRHYTGTYTASIQVTDNPLTLLYAPWIKYVKTPALLTQILLILSISHITLIPSMEHGLIRHTQSNAMDFSPARYWLTLYVWDVIIYILMVGIMTIMLALVMFFLAPENYFIYEDLIILPIILTVYGIGCIPQAYVFSLGPNMALNSLTFIFINIIFGESTLISNVFFGGALDFLLYFLSLSPQFNMAYALIKIKVDFILNTECRIYKLRKLCLKQSLHRCCQKCGVLQKCFTRVPYFYRVLNQILLLFFTSVVYMVILLMIEYKLFERLCRQIFMKWTISSLTEIELSLQSGALKEKADIAYKLDQIEKGKRNKSNMKGEMIDTFAEYLLAQNLTVERWGAVSLSHVFLGLGRGEAVALTGLKSMGRLTLCDLLAGFKMSSAGQLWGMSKWRQDRHPYQYAQQVSYSCEKETLPAWMTVYDGLWMVAILRGVPKRYADMEVMNLIDALELTKSKHTRIGEMHGVEMAKVHFATAVVGAPPVLVVDECTAYQKLSIRRAMYNILANLRKKGHAFIVSSSNVESHMPVTDRMAFLLSGHVYDIDTVDNLVKRYSDEGYTVVVHLKDEINVVDMFGRYFIEFVINDVTEVLVNVQILDGNLSWAAIFLRMEQMKEENHQVYSYIVTITTLDYIYNTLVHSDVAFQDIISKKQEAKFKASPEAISSLQTFDTRFQITKLTELPWSVIFHR